MDQTSLSSKLVLQRLLKTNRPPTDEERTIIQESIAPTNAELRAIETQITEALEHIEELKSHIKDTELKLQRLRQEEAALLGRSADHRGVLSTVRNLPEDIIREIFILCVDPNDYHGPPALSYGYTSLPDSLAQISSGMRQIALTTPAIWSSMSIHMSTRFDRDKHRDKQARRQSILARKAKRWFDRAGELPLTISITDSTYSYTSLQEDSPAPWSVLFDVILGYSTRWKILQLKSNCQDLSTAPPLLRTAMLSATDVPMLESLSISCEWGISSFRNIPMLSLPTLKRLTLETKWDSYSDFINISDFTVNWTNLTSVTIRGSEPDYISCFDEIADMLRQTRRLVFCDITSSPGSQSSAGEINLPRLEMLRVDDYTFNTRSSRDLSIFDLINAPALATLEIRAILLDMSLANFFQRSRGIRELSLSQSSTEVTLVDITELLHHCPSLSVLTLKPRNPADKPSDGNSFLRAFVEDSGAGIICPRLQSFNYTGGINFSLQTLQQFLELKQHEAGPLSTLLPWKRVLINMGWVDDLEIDHIRDLVSKKQAVGLDIQIYMKGNHLVI